MLEQAAAEQGQALKNAAMQEQQKLSAIAADKRILLIQDNLQGWIGWRQFAILFMCILLLLWNPSGCDETVEALEWTTYGSVALIRAVEAGTVRTRRRDMLWNRKCSRSELVGYYFCTGLRWRGNCRVLGAEHPTGWLEEREARQGP